MRKRYFWKPTGAGQRWPDPAASGGQGGLVPFNWLKIDNRGANPVRVSLSPQAADDDMDYIASVKNGEVRTMNLAGPHDVAEKGDGWPHEISLISVTGGTTVLIEIADHPIVDTEFAT